MQFLPLRDNPRLTALLEKAKQKVAAMTHDELEAMLQTQRENYIKSVTSLPRARYKFIDGVQVFESRADAILD